MLKLLWLKLLLPFKITSKAGVNIWTFSEWILMSLPEKFKWTIILGKSNKFKLKSTQSFKNKKLWEKNFLKTSKFHFLKSAAKKWNSFFHKSTQLCKKIWLEWSAKRPNPNLKLYSTHLPWCNKSWKKTHKKYKNWPTLKTTLLPCQLKWNEWRQKWWKFLMFTRSWKSSRKRFPKTKWTKNGLFLVNQKNCWIWLKSVTKIFKKRRPCFCKRWKSPSKTSSKISTICNEPFLTSTHGKISKTMRLLPKVVLKLTSPFKPFKKTPESSTADKLCSTWTPPITVKSSKWSKNSLLTATCGSPLINGSKTLKSGPTESGNLWMLLLLKSSWIKASESLEVPSDSSRKETLRPY